MEKDLALAVGFSSLCTLFNVTASVLEQVVEAERRRYFSLFSISNKMDSEAINNGGDDHSFPKHGISKSRSTEKKIGKEIIFDNGERSIRDPRREFDGGGSGVVLQGFLCEQAGTRCSKN